MSSPETSPKSQPRSNLLDIKSQKWHTVFSPSGNKYTGEWLGNKKHGWGTQVWKKSGAIYDGEWEFGKYDGYGTYRVPHPDTKEYEKKYCGGWKNGKKHGYGTYYYTNAAFYEGNWSEDHRNGWGRMYYENGDIYEGEWLKDKNHGHGHIRYANGNWYEGAWRNGSKDGYGKFYYPDKGQLYEGVWVDGVAKCGTLSDFCQDEAPTPTKRPIPQLYLVDRHLVLKEAQSAYLDQH